MFAEVYFVLQRGIGICRTILAWIGDQRTLERILSRDPREHRFWSRFSRVARCETYAFTSFAEIRVPCVVSRLFVLTRLLLGDGCESDYGQNVLWSWEPRSVMAIVRWFEMGEGECDHCVWLVFLQRTGFRSSHALPGCALLTDIAAITLVLHGH